MNLDELRGVQRAERQRDSLQHLRDSFYEDVAAFLAGLKEERQRAVDAADDPFASADVRQVTDEIETTKEIANAIYERRVGKVVKLASFAAADMETDQDGMTAEERALFDDLVERIRGNRETVLSTLDGTGGASEPSLTDSVDSDTVDGGATTGGEPANVGPTDSPGEVDEGRRVDTTDADAELLSDALGTDSSTSSSGNDGAGGKTPNSTGTGSAESDSTDGSGRPVDEAAVVAGADAEGGETATTPTPSGPTDSDGQSAPMDRESTSTDREELGRDTVDADALENHARTTVRITTDVGTILGVDDMEYDLAREDVVTLPTTNAEPLIEREAAERFD